MTRLDYWAGIATYGGALVMLAGLIGGWLWPLAVGGVALAVGLLALNTSESPPSRPPRGRTGAAPSPVTPTGPTPTKTQHTNQGEKQ